MRFFLAGVFVLANDIMNRVKHDVENKFSMHTKNKTNTFESREFDRTPADLILDNFGHSLYHNEIFEAS